MSVMSELHLDIEEMLLQGTMSYEEIATTLEIPVSWVTEVVSTVIDTESYYYGA